MSLINKRNTAGFTIVELLIVVVVIAILAAITIVSYNGITARANSSAAQATAAATQKKAEAFNAENNGYPDNMTRLTTASSDKSWYLSGVSPTSTTAFNVAPNSSNGKNTVQYVPCGVGSGTTAPTTQGAVGTYTGAQIIYFNFSGGTTTVNVGQVSGTFNVSGQDRNVACPTAA